MARAVIMGGGVGRLTELRMLGDADFVEKFDAFGLSCGGKETVLRHLLGLVAQFGGLVKQVVVRGLCQGHI